ncbi:MAG: hypothetical protein M3552_13775 [Planctomycetota bacterium]|nr:hypothetical protein [Planctomycetaceae bacterium]MDQ3331700.1 hypothetical protein [Planctomycetota bacterium]
MKPGDWVVYVKPKYGVAPGPRAKEVSPNRQGEGYSYVVEKYWIVAETLSDGRLKLRTRRGKEHMIRADDANLRRARWWERWYYRDRFRDAESNTMVAESLSRTATNGAEPQDRL